jgi:hypothetical protein
MAKSPLTRHPAEASAQPGVPVDIWVWCPARPSRRLRVVGLRRETVQRPPSAGAGRLWYRWHRPAASPMRPNRSEYRAAIVLWSGGDLARLSDAVALAAADWRDVLMRADLADGDWSLRLDAELGTTTP